MSEDYSTPRSIEELQSRPDVYNCAHPDYHTKRQEKLAELGAIFSMTGLTIPILYVYIIYIYIIYIYIYIYKYTYTHSVV